ncbi:MAG: branched-chain-amino-acid transaminase [bacterium]|nr:branched-chain-amino-acid transaminase [bacterium]
MKIWIDGRIVGPEEAHIPVTDHGLLYGDGVFEGIRVYGGKVFRLDRHLARLQFSASAIGLAIPGGIDRVRAVVHETAAAFGSHESYIRLLLTRGDGTIGVDPTRCPEPRLICICCDAELYDPEHLAQGLTLVTSSLRRPALDALDPRVKSLNYLNSVMAKREAKLRGADEGLLLNAAGLVAEATVANIFIHRKGALRTPPTCDGALEGITRETVIELAGGLGIPAHEQSLSRMDLLSADEIFLTGTGARIVPVRSFDSQDIGTEVPGPVTSKLMAAFDELVERI